MLPVSQDFNKNNETAHLTRENTAFILKRSYEKGTCGPTGEGGPGLSGAFPKKEEVISKEESGQRDLSVGDRSSLRLRKPTVEELEGARPYHRHRSPKLLGPVSPDLGQSRPLGRKTEPDGPRSACAPGSALALPSLPPPYGPPKRQKPTCLHSPRGGVSGVPAHLLANDLSLGTGSW